MSEYQYYEFLAIDRPLEDDERAYVRSLSTRATIMATSEDQAAPAGGQDHDAFISGDTGFGGHRDLPGDPARVSHLGGHIQQQPIEPGRPRLREWGSEA